MHKYLFMVTGYSTVTISESRQRLKDLLTGIDGVIKLQKQAKDNEQYKIDASALYVAAKQSLLGLSKDYDIFRRFVDLNKANLFDKELEYFQYMIESIRQQIEYLEDTIIIPSLLVPVSDKPLSDSEVGASFKGTITLVSDGDTVIVKQVPTVEGGEGLSHTVRLAGIDCPESGTPRGKFVAQATSDFWTDKEVEVFYDRHTPNDLYGRVLGTIYWGDVNFSIWSLEHCFTEPNLKFGKNHFVDPVEIRQAAKRCLSSWPTIGIVKIISTPSHASIFTRMVGNEDLDFVQADGITPCEVELPVGKYDLILTAPGCSSVRDQIDVRPIKRQLPAYILTKLPVTTGAVRIDVAPIGVRAIVSVDSVPVGLAPLTLDLSLSSPSHVRVVFDGEYEAYDEDVLPEIGNVKRIVVIPHKTV